MTIATCCPACGAPIATDAPAGLCTPCLLKEALAEDNAELAEADLTPILLQRAPALGVQLYSFGDYQLLDEAARGGMGVVFRARQLSLYRIVALKFIHPGRLSSRDAVRRFRQEAEAAASLDHPNIVPIYEIGEHQGHLFFSMMFMERGTLADRMTELQSNLAQTTLEIRHRNSTIATLLAKVARAVHYAHQRGVIHRDLKPSNILLDGQGEPHLTDFGLAKVLTADVSLTLSADVLGSPHYMAPEQAAGHVRQVTTAVDIYSLGALLYELLTGQPAFAGSTPLEILRQTQEQAPRPPRHFHPQVDRDLETICLKCLEKKPEHRYGSAAGLAADLERRLRHEPILARPTTAWERFMKWTRRNQALASTAGALLLVLVLGVVGVLVQWGRAEAAAETMRGNLYVSDMIVADKALREGNTRRAKALLDGHVPEFSAKKDLRGFEFYYLRQQCEGEQLFSFPPQASKVVALAYSPDGKMLATGSSWLEEKDYSGELKLFDVAARKEIATLISPNPDGVRSVAFSPEGKLLAAGNASSTITIFDLASRQQVTAFFGNAGPVSQVAFSSDGRFVAGAFPGTSWTVPGKIQMWDMVTGAMGEVFQLNNPSCVAFAFLPNGRGLAFADMLPPNSISLLKIWDLQSRRLTATKAQAFEGELTCLAASPDSELLAFGMPTGLVGLWEIKGDQVVTLGRHEDAVLSLDFASDGRKLATSGVDGVVKLWDLPARKEFRLLRGHSDAVQQVTFSPDATQLASASLDKTVRLWPAVSADRDVLRGHAGSVRAVTFSPDGARLATAGASGLVTIWDPSSCGIQQTLSGSSNEVTRLAFSPDGAYLVAGGINQKIRVWDTRKNWMLVATLDSAAEFLNTHSLSFSPDGRYLFAGELGEIGVWEVQGWRFATNFNGVHAGLAAPAPNGKLLATCGVDTVQLWEPGTWKHLQTLTSERARFGGVPFTPDGNTATPRLTGGFTSLVFSPDSRLLVAGGTDSTLTMWRLPEAKSLGSLRRHAGSVVALAISPDGKTLAASDASGTIQLWNLATRKELFTLTGHQAAVWSLAFSSNGTLASGSSDGTIHLWRAAALAATPAPKLSRAKEGEKQ